MGVLKWKGVERGSKHVVPFEMFEATKKLEAPRKLGEFEGRSMGPQLSCGFPSCSWRSWNPVTSGQESIFVTTKTLHIQCIRDYQSINQIQ